MKHLINNKTIAALLAIFFVLNISVIADSGNKNKTQDHTSLAKITGTADGQNTKITNPYTNSQVTYFAGTFNGSLNSSNAKFYCIDLQHYLVYNEDYWDEGNTPSEITYILNNYFPFKNGYSGQLSSTNKEAAAIQTAIWHFSDGLDVSTIANDNDVKNRAIAIVADADANHNNVVPVQSLQFIPASFNLPQGTPASFKVKAMDINGNPASGVVITISTNLGILSSISEVTDINGETPVITLTNNSVGIATLNASANVIIPQGTKYVHKNNPNGKQKLVLANPQTDTKQTTASVNWNSNTTVVKTTEEELCAVNNSNITYTIGKLITEELSNGDIRVKIEVSKALNDNTYGTNKIGWSSHTFDHLIKSDKAQFLFKDANGNSVLEFVLDYMSATSSYPSGYGIQGVTGNDGSMISGNASDILSYNSSLNRNFNEFGYILTSNSPATDANYTPNPSYPNWIYEMVYEVTIKGSAFGSAGFGSVEIPSMHHSPNKLNFDNAIYPVKCNTKASIGDKVWNDLNGNGIQDSGEPGVPNVTVNLYDCSNNFIATTTTNANGEYLFGSLIPNDYYVEFVLPSGSIFTTKDQGSDNGKDSDADITTGKTVCTTLTSGENDLSWDAGLQQNCMNKIGNFVWHDNNLNGIQDAGELGIANVVVELLDNANNVIATTTTNSTGAYEFSNLANGTYKVRVAASNYSVGGVLESTSQTKWYSTKKNQGSDDTKDSDADKYEIVSTSLSCNDDLTIDFGFYKTNVDIIKTADKTEANPGEVITYTFTVSNNGDIQLHGGVTVKDNMLGLDTNFVLNANSTAVFSRKYTVKSSDCGSIVNIVTAEGHPVDGSAIVTDQATFTVNIICKASLGDRVWNDLDKDGIQDAGEPGMPYVTVFLYDCTTNIIIATAVTDANGNYLFSNLTPGNYYVQFLLPSGYAFTLMNQGSDDALDSDAGLIGKTDCITLHGGVNNLTVDAGMYETPIASLGDKVWEDLNNNGIQDSGEQGLAYVVVKLHDCGGAVIATTITDANGNYLFTNLNPGDYYVEFVLPTDYVFSAQDQGSDDAVDSDADVNTGKTVCTNLIANENDVTWDAGMYKVAAIHPDIKVEKTASNPNPQDGDQFSYTITVTNLGAGNATDVTVKDVLPGKLNFVSSSATQGSYNQITGIWTIGNLNENQSVQLIINVQVDLGNCGTIDLKEAEGYNLFIFEDLTQPSSDTEGKVAVGGNATLSNYSVGDKLPANSGDVLIVGGNLLFTSGAVLHGNVVYGTATNLPIYPVSIDGTLRQDTVIDFAAAEVNLKALSSELSSYSSNGSTDNLWNNITLTGTDPLFNVFDLNGNDLSAAWGMTIDVPNGAVVLVNISGTTINWHGGLTVNGTAVNNILYNLYEATDLTIQGIDIRGSVLAPSADLNFTTGVVSGQVIVKSMSGAGQYNMGQFNNNLFTGNIPCSGYITNYAQLLTSSPEDNNTANNSASAQVFIGDMSNPGNEGGNTEDQGNWQSVANFAINEIIWSITNDLSGNLLVGTAGGSIYKSLDNGINWTKINSSMHVGYIWSLAVASNGNIYAGTEQGVFSSTDNGATWNGPLGGLIYDTRSIAIDPVTGDLYTGHWGFGIYKSVDGGANWTEVNNGLSSKVVNSLVIDANRKIYAGTFGGGVSVSNDFGATWTKSGLSYDYVWAVDVTSTGDVYAATYGAGVFMSADNGTSWSEMNNGLFAPYVYSVAVNGNDDVFVSTWVGGIFKLNNSNGSTGGNAPASVLAWQPVGMSGFGISALMVDKKNSVIYAGGKNGSVFMMKDGITGVNDEEIIPSEFSLSQNYPNPFNPTTTIEFGIKDNGNYTIKLYNLLGQEVRTLINENMNPGMYKVSLNASDLASGVYFYRLTGDKVNLTKKMVLMK